MGKNIRYVCVFDVVGMCGGREMGNEKKGEQKRKVGCFFCFVV